MTTQTQLILTVLVPLAGAFVLPVMGSGSRSFRNALAFLLVLTPLVLLGRMLPAALSGEIPRANWSLPLGLSFGLRADGLALFMAMVSSSLGLIILVYSYGYMAHEGHQNEYYLFVVLFIGAMMGIVLTTNLMMLYVFWEISAICCWRLIGFFRQPETIRRANKALLLTGGGALVMLGGFLMVHQQHGTFDLMLLQGKGISPLAMALILVGILSKSATLPLHSWIADAGVAPTPATSLLHAAVLVKIGVYAYARLFVVTFVPQDFWRMVIPVIAGISALLTAGAAIAETDIKRIIAYSTVSQIGFILLGLSVGGEMALAGGLMYILMHAISKAGLFLCAGIVEHGCHTKDIRKMGGLAKTMPVTALSFLLCALSVMGIPPFGGFFSKYLVISGAVEAGQPLIALIFLIGAVMTLIYLLRAFVRVFLGMAQGEHLPKEGTLTMVGMVALLGILSLGSGLVIQPSADLIRDIVNQMAVMIP